jgi:small subunit ribosomal protein S15
MSITKEETANYIQKYAKSAKDTGSIPAQVAILTHRINSITQHLQSHHHDQHTKRGLIGLVNKRKSVLKYLKRVNLESYTSITNALGLRG